MNDKKKLIILLIIFNLIFILQSCNKGSFIFLDYPSSYYVNSINTKFGYQFAYDKKIDEFEIVSFKNETKKQYTFNFIKEINESGSQMKINNYYVYGIVFDFGRENDYFESFDIKINNKIEKTIELNMKINSVDTSENSDILPLSIPFIGDITKEVEWVILPLTDIKITNVEINNSQNLSYSLLINSLEQNSERSYIAKEKIYISSSFDDDNAISFNYMYLSISYVDSNGTEKTFNTDISLFGNSIDALRSKIC